jgi:hypothetical protein
MRERDGVAEVGLGCFRRPCFARSSPRTHIASGQST